MRNLSLTECILFLSSIAILSSIYFIYEFKNKRLRFNRILFWVLLILFILSIISSFIIPTEFSFQKEYENAWIVNFVFNITLEDRFINIFVNFTILYFVYLIIGVLPQKIHNLRQLNFVFYGILITGIFSLLYSCFSDFEGYKQIFSGNIETYNLIVSFTNNSNNYAGILFLGVASTLLLLHTTNKRWLYIPTILMFIAMLPTFSRTNILAGFVLIVTVAITRMIFDFKNHKKGYLIALLTTSLVIVVVGLSYLICRITNCTGYFAPFKLFDVFIDKFGKGMDGRNVIWEHAIGIINSSSSWALGCGNYIFSNSVIYCQSISYEELLSSSPHNGYLQTIGNSGIVFLVFSILCLIYLGYCCVKVWKKEKFLVTFTAAMVLIMLFNMISEAPGILSPGVALVTYVFMNVLIFLPVLSCYYHQCHSTVNSQIIYEQKNYKKTKIINSVDDSISFVSFILCIIAIIFIGVLVPYLHQLPMTIVSLVLFGLVFVIPLIYRLIKKNFSIKKYFFDVVLPYGLISVVMISISHILFKFIAISEIAFALLIVLFLTLYFALFLFTPILNSKIPYMNNFLDKIKKIYVEYIFKNKVNNSNNEEDTLIEKIELKTHLRRAKQ